jgi:hypothetical protein
MKISNTAIAAASMLMLVSILGCTANEPFRAGRHPVGPGIESQDGYNLGFVEFDDQGWLWSPDQLKAVRNMIADETGINSGDPSSSHHMILIVFVHGWKHNAGENDSNLCSFRAVLKQLAISEGIGGRTPRKVIGVFVGWRGLSEKVEPFEELSFWERKETAHKVGGYGSLTELLVNLEDLQKESDALAVPGARPSELVIIGHSFGAAALFSALGQIITERFVMTRDGPWTPATRPATHPTMPRLKPVGDQVILLNPAFEAARFHDLEQLGRSLKDREYAPTQRPVLSIFTSQADWATHYVFPIGEFFSTFFQSSRDADQKAANVQTVGWFGPFINHTLDSNDNTPPGKSICETNGADFHFETEFLGQSHENIQARRNDWVNGQGNNQSYRFRDCTLNPKTSAHVPTHDPFLVISVDSNIMNGHNDIDNPKFLNFLREYILFCQKGEDEPRSN